jgi:hypothetical protein
VGKLSVDQALLKARSHVKKGEKEEAQKIYQVILQNSLRINRRNRLSLL